MAAAELERLFAALEALPDDKLAGALPVVLLMFVPLLGDAPLPAPLQETLAAFERSLGVEPASPEADRRAALERHMAAHGLDGAFWRDLTSALRGSPADVAAAAKKLIASERVAGALQRTAPPPPGAVAAGPAARFAAGKALDEKKG